MPAALLGVHQRGCADAAEAMEAGAVNTLMADVSLFLTKEPHRSCGRKKPYPEIRLNERRKESCHRFLAPTAGSAWPLNGVSATPGLVD
ncbi:UNVERIFIED_CONTAM: hypothetical protein K2H54_036530, partial [Gekko kuhli]